MPRIYTRRPAYDRVMDKVIFQDGHWLWTGAVGSSGYGHTQTADGKYLSVTHVVWEHHRGPVPPGLVLDHLEECLTILCCNPDHLEPVTQAENRRRQSERRKSCNKGHSYVPGSFRIAKNGGRACKQCHADRVNAARQREREQFITHCPRGHLRTPENTFPAGNGLRCGDCTSEGALQRWAAARERGSGSPA